MAKRNRAALQALPDGDSYAQLCKRMTDRGLQIMMRDLIDKHDAHRVSTYEMSTLMHLAPAVGVPQYKRDLFAAVKREMFTRKGVILEPNADGGLPVTKRATKGQRDADHHVELRNPPSRADYSRAFLGNVYGTSK